MAIKYYPENKSPNIEQHLDKEGKFLDNDFPNNDDSLFNKEKGVRDEKFEKEVREFIKVNEKYKFKWIRLFSSNEYIFDSNLSTSELIEKEKKLNLIQGGIGNCYFISYLHKLKCEKPDIFTSIIRDVKPKKGYMEVNFFVERNNKIEEVVVYVDDYIPYIDFYNYHPLFSYYESLEEKKYVAGLYFLVEKAYAKFCGSYCNIDGSNQKNDYMFNLTGTKIEIKNLYDFHIDYTKNFQNKNLKLNILPKEDKNKIFTKINDFSKENIMTVGTPKKYEEGETNIYGVVSNHEYDYIKGVILSSNDNKNEDFFFQLWNPHGENENPESSKFSLMNLISYPLMWLWGKNEKIPGKYKYEGFDNINSLNENGFKTGDIYLNFERFFYSFERFSYQNRKKVSENYAKYHKNDDILKLFNLKLFILYFCKSLFFQRPDYFLAKIMMELHKNDDIKSENIIKNIIKDEKNNFLSQTSSDEDKENLELINKEIKNEILEKSKEIMNEKIKGLNINDEEKLSKELIDYNKNTNEYLILGEQKNFPLLIQTKSEITALSKKLAENYIKNRKKENEFYNNNYFQFNFNKPINKYGDRNIVIRSSLCNKNLDICGNNIKNETPIILFDAHGGGSQTFYLVHNGDGSVTFKKNNYAIDVRYSKMENGNFIQIYQCNGTNAQKFFCKDRENGYKSIHSAINQKFCIDVQYSQTKNFTKIQLWEWNDSNAQKFKFINN